jgi:ribosome recycling factor
MYDFSSLQARIDETKEWLRKEYQGLRTGRATPTLLDSIQVEVYESRIPLNQAASVGVEDARTLRISAWDASHVKEIEKAITNANLGVGVSADEKGVRVTFPELTTERRDSLIRIAKERLEEARKSIRTARDEVWSDIQAQEKKGSISEDQKFRYKNELQDYVDEGNKLLEETFTKKEEEIQR